MSVLNKQVSYFPSVKATAQGVEMGLLTLLQSNKHKGAILRLRSEPDEEVQKQLKDKLPCYTVAGTFSQRRDDCLLTLSGLAAVDLDSAQDYDVTHLLHELRKIDCIAYAGLSCRGNRLFCIVPFLYPEKYVKHYERLLKSFADMGLPMGDACHRIISQPRFVSWNAPGTHFFNHDARPYYLLPAESTYHFVQHQNPGAGALPANAFQWCVEQINKSYSFGEGARHNYILHLARYCNLKGLLENETLNGCLRFVQRDFPEAEIKKIVVHIYQTQSDSHAKHHFTKTAAFQKRRQTELNPNETERPQQPGNLTKLNIQGSENLSKPVIKERQKQVEAPKPELLAIVSVHENKQPESWEQDIADLEHYFEATPLPAGPVTVKPYSTMTNVSQFIHSHLDTVKVNYGKRTFLPYLNRLQELKHYLILNTLSDENRN